MSSGEFILSIESNGDDLDQVNQQAANLQVLLADSEHIRVVGRAKAGETLGERSEETKADPVTLAAIILALVTTGTLSALATSMKEVAKAIIDAIKASRPDWQRAKVTFKVGAPGRNPFEFNGEELSEKQSDRVLSALEEYLKGSAAAPEPSRADEPPREPVNH